MGNSFMDLAVWQRAVQLSTKIYRLTASYPKSEQFGLVNQMRRASVSIASNIAEGTAGQQEANICSPSATREARNASCRRNSSSQNHLGSALENYTNSQSNCAPMSAGCSLL